jgi:hypothetical protein
MGDNAETNAYLEKHDLAGTISTLIAETLKKQPANPYKALVRDRLPLLSFLPSPIDGQERHTRLSQRHAMPRRSGAREPGQCASAVLARRPAGLGAAHWAELPRSQQHKQDCHSIGPAALAAARRATQPQPTRAAQRGPAALSNLFKAVVVRN